MDVKWGRAWVGEFLGSVLLLAGVVGSGIMGIRLSQGNMALALLANALATGFLLPVLIQIFGPISGAHFNPLVTFAEVVHRRLSGLNAVGYIIAQVGGALCGVWLAHAMFGEPLWQLSQHVRFGAGQWISEVVATLGLLLLVLRRDRIPLGQLPWLVGAYIASAYWFTASTSFANPAVTLARAFTGSFAGIRLLDVPGFVMAQVLGASMALGLDIGFRKWEFRHDSA